MISLARTDGARKDILELCTHTPRKSGNTIDLYTTFPWEALCAEVAKLKVQRHERGQLARLPLAASAEKESPGSPETVSPETVSKNSPPETVSKNSPETVVKKPERSGRRAGVTRDSSNR